MHYKIIKIMRERRVQFNTLKKGVDFMKKKKTLFMMLLRVFVLMAVLGVTYMRKSLKPLPY